jgi:hypothetical protein
MNSPSCSCSSVRTGLSSPPKAFTSSKSAAHSSLERRGGQSDAQLHHERFDLMAIG